MPAIVANKKHGHAQRFSQLQFSFETMTKRDFIENLAELRLPVAYAVCGLVALMLCAGVARDSLASETTSSHQALQTHLSPRGSYETLAGAHHAESTNGPKATWVFTAQENDRPQEVQPREARLVRRSEPVTRHINPTVLGVEQWRVASQSQETFVLNRMGHYLQAELRSGLDAERDSLFFTCAPTAEPTLICLWTVEGSEQFFIVPPSAPNEPASDRIFRIEIEPGDQKRTLTIAYATVMDAGQVRRAMATPFVELTSETGIRVQLGLAPKLNFRGQTMGSEFLSLLEGLPTRDQSGSVMLEPWADPFVAGGELTISRVAWGPSKEMPDAVLLEPHEPAVQQEPPAMVQEHRAFRLLDSGVGVCDITIENLSDIARMHPFRFHGGESVQIEVKSLETPVGQNDRRRRLPLEQPLGSLASGFNAAAVSSIVPNWMLARAGDRVLAFGFDDSNRVGVDGQPYWAIGWRVLDALNGPTREPEVQIDEDRFEVSMELLLPPRSKRTLRVAFAVNEQLNDGMSLLDQALEAAEIEATETAPSLSNGAMGELSWNASHRDWSLFLIDHSHRVLDIAREQREPLEMVKLPGFAIRPLTDLQSQLIARDLIWVDSKQSAAWIALQIEQCEQDWVLDDELDQLGFKVNAIDQSEHLGWAVLAWRHYLVHRDEQALGQMAQSLSRRMKRLRSRSLEGFDEPLASGFFATANLDDLLWAEDMAAMQSISIVTGDAAEAEAYGESVETFLRSQATRVSQGAHPDRLIAEFASLEVSPQPRLDLWWKQWLSNRPAFHSRMASAGVYPLGLDGISSGENTYTAERMIWSSLAAHEFAELEAGAKQTLSELESIWALRRSGGTPIAFAPLIEPSKPSGNELKITDECYSEWNAIDWTLERLTGLTMHDDGRVTLDPAKSNLSWSRCELPNFRGQRLIIQWNTGSGDAVVEQSSAAVQQLPAISPGLIVTWGDKTLLNLDEFSFEQEPIELFPAFDSKQ